MAYPTQAHLEDWYTVRDKDGTRTIIGVISGDVKKRFPDGRRVRTSNVKWLSREFGQAQTLNTLYSLGKERENQQ